MKKIFLLVAFATVAFSADASYMLKTWCGEVCQTVSEDYFENRDEWLDYIKEMTILMCGSATNPNIDTEDHDTSSDEQP